MVKIALIDDHEMMLNSLAKAMQEQANLEVVGTFTDVASFQLFLKTTEVDLVIMDVMLKGETAFQVLEKLQKSLSDMPKVILISGFYDELLHQRALKLGVQAFLRKESSYDELMRAIQEVMAGNVLIPDKVFNQPDDEKLTEVELAVLQAMADEKTNPQIAEELFMSQRTVESHVTNICRKLGVGGRIGAVREALKRKLIL
ncbi:response regulator transcription factor [Limosilactobacillus fermentum]|uniref:response regulator transcription factor n=1 Tax=Limosilactobacillus fermentum TaxID=1613 RepID=UPI00209C109C|nr:response regulator transcription factor [Limosilactobacillus fermentum]MCO8299429.1 response regulator transcription factor [Limosilactobacillus fermentum]